MLGGAGLTSSVINEIDRCLNAHKLIKIRVLESDRQQREELIAQICEVTGATPIQHIGKILVIYREEPVPSGSEPRSPANLAAGKPRARSPDQSRRVGALGEDIPDSAMRQEPLQPSDRRRRRRSQPAVRARGRN